MCRLLIVGGSQADQQAIGQQLDEFLNVKLLPFAQNGLEAIKTAQQFLPEIVLLDLDLSDSSGFDIKKQLLGLLPNLKVILFSASKDFDKIQHALRCGVLDYLVKPLAAEELRFSIDRAIKSLNQVSLMDVAKKRPTKNAREQVNIMLDYIHEQYANEISLTSLAEYMHLNRHYVSRFFKDAIGMNFIDYLTNFRVETAKQLLMTTDRSITDVAESVGYVDPAYFSKLFKKEAHLTPHQYRKNFQGSYMPADLRVLS